MACFSSEEALESAAAATLLRSPETKERLKIYLFQDLRGEGGGGEFWEDHIVFRRNGGEVNNNLSLRKLPELNVWQMKNPLISKS